VKASVALALALAVAVFATARADQAKPPAAAAGSAHVPSAGAPAGGMRPPDPKPQPAMPEMKPAPEIADAAKAMVGTYTCKGVDMNPDGSSRPAVSKMKISLEMNGYYILVDLSEQKSKDNATPLAAKMYRTYDATSKKWMNTIIASAPGGPVTMTTTDAMGTGPVTWTGTGTYAGQSFTEKSHEEPDAKTKSVHVWGEFSMDGGKTFQKDYDTTCKK
jgi:hypothetical protein